MNQGIKAAVLAAALSFAPACSTLPVSTEAASTAYSMDVEAYALISGYAVILESAARAAADPATPSAVIRALARAEAVATPALETLKIAVVAYLQAQADWRALPPESEPAARAAGALSSAGAHLQTAIEEARAPMRALQDALQR